MALLIQGSHFFEANHRRFDKSTAMESVCKERKKCRSRHMLEATPSLTFSSQAHSGEIRIQILLALLGVVRLALRAPGLIVISTERGKFGQVSKGGPEMDPM